jgi:carboxyl-terminal processing protease
MHKKSVFIALFLGSILFVSFFPSASMEDKEQVLLQRLKYLLKEFHYHPKEINDDFSEDLYNLYLDRLDSGKRWLTKEDIALLEPYKYRLDDDLKASNFEFFDLSVELIKNRWIETQTYYRAALENQFDFTTDKGVSYEMDGEKRAYTSAGAVQRELWTNICKYDVMVGLYDDLEEQKETKDEELKAKTQEELEADNREDVLESYDKWYDRLEKRDRIDFLTIYLNSITNYFDPHTAYYEPIDKENFDIQMSGKLEGIGARLMMEDEYTKVSSIVVGGPAWKQGDLSEDDKIYQVAQEGEEPVNVKGMELDDVVQLIRGKKGTIVKLSVKKVDGTKQDIEIIRDVVELEEGFAKSLMLDTKSGNKVGYINLPRFYDDFGDPNGRSCATDVEKEIAKLKENNVEGIILDLRNNGGGSLRDVVRMSGFFFEDGPVVQVKDRFSSPRIMRDTDESVQWDGHLIVMVNQYSASASEIIAAALQDYDRAIIVGSESTFGKGSVQRFVDLDRIAGDVEMQPFGQVKVTIQKFYRVNGGSTQLKGVESDIVLPDQFQKLELGEKEQDFAMEWSKIDPVDYDQKTRDIGSIRGLLISNSKSRIAENTSYIEINKYADYLDAQQDNTAYPLNIDDYGSMVQAMDEKGESFKSLFDAEVISNIQNLEQDSEYINASEERKSRNEEWVKGVKKDLHLSEVLNIMEDMINLKDN